MLSHSELGGHMYEVSLKIFSNLSFMLINNFDFRLFSFAIPLDIIA